MAPSVAWKFFKVDTSNDTFCKCNFCNVSISRGGKTAKTFTTSNMLNHLKKFHPDELAEETSKMKKNNVDDGCSSESNKSPAKTAKTQTSLTEILEMKKTWDINDHRSKNIHFLIGEMIAVDLQPYSLVSDLGFQRLLKKISPSYNIPSRKYFSEKIIPEIYEIVQTKIQKFITDANYISLTTDIWTASANNSPFLSITGHWLTDQFQQERAVLKIVPFEDSHTDTQIREELSNVLRNYKLTNDNIFLVIQNSGANMVAGVRNCGLESLSCFIHTLQLTLNESIFSQQAVKTIITTSQNIVEHFNHSAVAVNKLTELQELLGLKKHKLIQNVPNRWNSTYYMLERNIEQRKALVTYAVDINIPTLNDSQWSLAEKIVQLIKPFEEITVEASKREATTSIIIPTIQTMKLFLSKAKTSICFAGTHTTIEELQSSVENKFSTHLKNKSLCLSSLLDPRFKMIFQRTDMVEKIKEWTLDNLENVYALECGGDSIEDSSTFKDDQEHGGASLTFSNLFDELASGKLENDQEQASQRKKQKMEPTSKKFCCNKELEEYLNLPVLPRHGDPYLWWRNSKELFPSLSKLALKYLSAPASSVENERMFSTGGNMYEAARNRLCPENGEILMFLHYNLRVLKFDY